MKKSSLTESEKKFLWKLMAVSGLSWTLALLLMVKIGFQDQITTIPLVALAMNLAWTFYYGFVKPQQMPQKLINRIWFSLYAILGLQFFIFKHPFVFFQLSSLHTGLFLVGVTVFSYFFVSGAHQEFDDEKGKYMGFGTNLVMSILFIVMCLARNSIEGQSIYILLLMMLGTLIPSYCFYRGYPTSRLLNTMYLLTLVFDIGYFFLLMHMHKLAGVSAWLRF